MLSTKGEQYVCMKQHEDCTKGIPGTLQGSDSKRARLGLVAIEEEIVVVQHFDTYEYNVIIISSHFCS